MVGLCRLVVYELQPCLLAYQGHESIVLVCWRRALIVLRGSRHAHAPIVRHVGVGSDDSRIVVFELQYGGAVSLLSWGGGGSGGAGG